VRAWHGLDGVRHSAGHTLPNRAEADQCLRDKLNRRRSGTRTDRRLRSTLREFVDDIRWPTKTDLAVRTREVSDGLLRHWIYAEVTWPGRAPLPLGDLPVVQITENEIEQ
jgi:hypothetical protein